MADRFDGDEGFEPQGEELFSGAETDLPNWSSSPAFAKAKEAVKRTAQFHGNKVGNRIREIAEQTISNLGGDVDGEAEDYMYEMSQELMNTFLEEFEQYMPFPFFTA